MNLAHRRFTRKLKKLRGDMSQEAVAKKAGISREYLARLEAGRQDPSLSTLRKLAKALGVSVAELLG